MDGANELTESKRESNKVLKKMKQDLRLDQVNNNSMLIMLFCLIFLPQINFPVALIMVILKYFYRMAIYILLLYICAEGRSVASLGEGSR